MKRSITPTSVERVMREGDFIVSMTDIKGRITYGNRIFIEFSGYSSSELIGTQHNIIRHPDMPRAVFQLLWDKMQAGNECLRNNLLFKAHQLNTGWECGEKVQTEIIGAMQDVETASNEVMKILNSVVFEKYSDIAVAR